ncbi:hypothetical protein [Thalassolituus sp.]|jgi:hypothetical protein|uniref:hypothetical protein n=1 Tax=Thalassolituus sp. TaxID=2030822 RepID=UPI002A840861|nr:hypothetical protein [Thalassolituus sp.]
MTELAEKIMNPPPKKNGIQQIYENLERIKTEHTTDFLQKIIDYTEKLKKSCTNLDDWQSDYQTLADRRMRGLILLHPVWAAMYVDNRNRPDIQKLQFEFLMGLKSEHSKNLKNHDIDGFGLIIRKCQMMPPVDVDGVNATDILDLLRLSPSQLKNSKRFLFVCNGENVHRRRFSKKSFIDGLNISKKISKNGVQIDRDGHLEVIIPSDPDDAESLPGIAEYFEKNSNQNNGLEKNENFEIERQYLQIGEIRSTTVEVRLAGRDSTNIMNRLRRENAAIAIDNRQLSDHELGEIWGLIRHGEGWYDSDEIEWLVIRILKLSLNYGFNVTKILGITRKSTNANSQLSMDRIYYDAENNSIHIPRINPEYKKIEKPVFTENRSNALYHATHVELPNYAMTVRDMTCLINKINKFDEAVIKKEIRNILSTLNIDTSRFTVSRISNSIINIARTSFDPMIVQTTFGHNISSTSAPRFYSVITSEEIYRCYRFSLKTLISRCGGYLPIDDRTSQVGVFSARYVPGTQDVSLLLKKLAKSCQETEVLTNDWHNNITLLCIVTQSIFTAVRGINDPLIEIDSGCDILYFRDKDNFKFSHARFQPVHPMAIKISKFYRFVRELSIQRVFADNKNDNFCFFIDDNNYIVDSRVCNIEKYLSDFSNLPINSMRKYLKNKLRELGVSYEASGMVMNHHSMGEAIWDDFSVHCPVIARKSILDAYEKIIIELEINEGWFQYAN